MNLIHDPWIPVRRQSGEIRIAPWQITDPDDPVLALAAPRPDFNGALLQFLIGLLQTAAAPETEEQWDRRLEEPPSPSELKSRVETHAYAFEMFGDGPRFLQDFNELEGETKPVANLIIDAPGANTLRQNSDHFVKRGGIQALCPCCAATALFTLQTNAPSGGVGHRTSLRGGGPLTTLVRLDPQASGLKDTLWRSVWLNVLLAATLTSLTGDEHLQAREAMFPWLASTRSSEDKTGCDTTPLDAHPLQMYWGMPRRIRLDWQHTHSGNCSLCGSASDRLVKHYITSNYGINYAGAWKHPLSPHRINKEKEALPRHAKPGALGYRHWLSLADNTDASEPARVISAFYRRRLPDEQFRLHVFGYDMDNMKARCWYETDVPLFFLEQRLRQVFTAQVQKLIDTATDTASVVRNCIKDAWFKRPGDARGDTSFLAETFFQHTESAFYGSLNTLKKLLEQGGDGLPVLRNWHTTLTFEAHNLFDYWTARGDFETVNPRRIAMAHKKLNKWLHGKKLKGRLGLSSDKEKAA